MSIRYQISNPIKNFKRIALTMSSEFSKSDILSVSLIWVYIRLYRTDLSAENGAIKKNK